MCAGAGGCGGAAGDAAAIAGVAAEVAVPQDESRFAAALGTVNPSKGTVPATPPVEPQ